jgi:hypothetical protein
MKAIDADEQNMFEMVVEPVIVSERLRRRELKRQYCRNSQCAGRALYQFHASPP